MTDVSPRGHKLSRLKRSVIPEHVIFVDTETSFKPIVNGKKPHVLKLGVAIYTRFRRDGKPNTKETFRFETIEQFWEYVSSKKISKTVLYLMAHNANYDFWVLKHISNLEDLKYKVKFTYQGSGTFIAKWMKPGHTIMILSTTNWFKGALSKWGAELDLPKLVMPKGADTKEKWFTYCERDTEILYQLFLWYRQFLVDNDLGSWKYTIASQAFTAFRHRFMNHPIYVPNRDDEGSLPREAYHGGRTECFWIGEHNEGPYYKLDTNSMYPYVMHNYEYPTSLEGEYDNPDKDKTREATRTKCILADCTLSTKLPYFVYRNNGRNIYPIGEFRTVLTTEEFITAYDIGNVIEVHRVAVYRKREIFQKYVDFFYGVKQQAGQEKKKLVRSFAKLYLNSLYGKFGQRGFIDDILGENELPALRISHAFDMDSGKRYTIKQIGSTVIRSSKDGEGYNSIAAIASHVCANARLYLYDTILRIGREHCYYCDTDSIICNQIGVDKIKPLLNNSKLGFWKIEEVADTLSIVAPKHYTFGDKLVLKGVRKDAEKLGNNRYRQEIWPGFNSMLAQGKEQYYTFEQIKVLSPSIKSGMVQKNGQVTPFVMTA